MKKAIKVLTVLSITIAILLSIMVYATANEDTVINEEEKDHGHANRDVICLETDCLSKNPNFISSFPNEYGTPNVGYVLIGDQTLKLLAEDEE